MKKIKTEREAHWAAMRADLEQAWRCWGGLYLLGPDPVGVWEPQERALFDLRPSLYEGYSGGLTPAQRLGEARTRLQDAVSAFSREFGAAVATEALGSWIGIPLKGK